MFDYIIIGAGAAGSVLADRLSASGRYRVLVLEAGGSDQRFWVRMPLGYGRTFNDAHVNWKYHTIAQSGLAGRSIYWPRGKVMGGSSSINAMVHMRGLPSDYDDWRLGGCSDWGADQVWPIFDRIEQRIDRKGSASGKGPVAVNDLRSYLHPMGRVLEEAAQQLGLPLSDDFNGPQPEGLGSYRFNIRYGRRWSASDAFLKPALRRPNVQLDLYAHATAIRFEDGRAVGVDYLHRGIPKNVRGGNIILCGGAVNSPQLLQLSGIGHGARLQALGINTLVDLPSVGRNLHDHLCVTYTFVSKRWTVNDQLNSILSLALHGARYVLTRSGPMALSVNQFGGYLHADPQNAHADTQLYFNPISYGAGAGANKDDSLRIDPFSGFILCHQPSRPTSRGQVDITSADPLAPPRIDPNYLSTPEDEAQVIASGRMIQRLAGSRAFRAITARILDPSVLTMDDDALLADFRARAGTVYHPVGSCRMGVDPQNSVVDQSLKVHGIDGLRIVDASVFPSIPSANTHAPTLMVAERAAEKIIADQA